MVALLLKKLIFTLILVFYFPVSVYAAEIPALSARSAVLINAETREVIYEKNSRERLSMASTTKIMTLLITLENVELEEVITVSAYAASMPNVQLHIKEGEQYFALHVRGASMKDAGILDGDIAIIRQCNSAQDGEIVVALIDDSVTLKRFFKEATRIRLQPENPDFNPIFSREVQILGVLSNILRTY